MPTWLERRDLQGLAAARSRGHHREHGRTAPARRSQRRRRLRSQRAGDRGARAGAARREQLRGPSGAPGPAAVRFVAVDLPAGAVPEVLAAAGQDVLVGARVDDREPRLLRLGPDAIATDVPAVPATGYGRTAAWYSVVCDGRRAGGRRRPRRRARQRPLERVERVHDRRPRTAAGLQHLRGLGSRRPDRRRARPGRRCAGRVVAELGRRPRPGCLDRRRRDLVAHRLHRHAAGEHAPEPGLRDRRDEPRIGHRGRRLAGRGGQGRPAPVVWQSAALTSG